MLIWHEMIRRWCQVSFRDRKWVSSQMHEFGSPSPIVYKALAAMHQSVWACLCVHVLCMFCVCTCAGICAMCEQEKVVASFDQIIHLHVFIFIYEFALRYVIIPFLLWKHVCLCECMHLHVRPKVSPSLRMPAGGLLKLWGPGSCRQERVSVCFWQLSP